MAQVEAKLCRGPKATMEVDGSAGLLGSPADLGMRVPDGNLGPLLNDGSLKNPTCVTCEHMDEPFSTHFDNNTQFPNLLNNTRRRHVWMNSF